MYPLSPPPFTADPVYGFAERGRINAHLAAREHGRRPASPSGPSDGVVQGDVAHRSLHQALWHDTPTLVSRPPAPARLGRRWRPSELHLCFLRTCLSACRSEDHRLRLPLPVSSNPIVSYVLALLALSACWREDWLAVRILATDGAGEGGLSLSRVPDMCALYGCMRVCVYVCVCMYVVGGWVYVQYVQYVQAGRHVDRSCDSRSVQGIAPSFPQYIRTSNGYGTEYCRRPS